LVVGVGFEVDVAVGGGVAVGSGEGDALGIAAYMVDVAKGCPRPGISVASAAACGDGALPQPGTNVESVTSIKAATRVDLVKAFIPQPS